VRLVRATIKQNKIEQNNIRATINVQRSSIDQRATINVQQNKIRATIND